MWIQEYREAFDPETRASRAKTDPRTAVQGIRAHGDTPNPARPAERHTAPRDEWSAMYASPIDTPDWTPGACPHRAIRETSIAGVLTNRECIECGERLGDRQWED